MSTAPWRFFDRGVGRRLFAFFILCAFIPLAALGVLSYTQLRDIFLEQGEKRLAVTAKSYGMSLYERLLLATEVAAISAAPGAAVPAEGSLTRRTFRNLGRVGRDGRVAAIYGNPAAPTLTPELRTRLAEGKPVLMVVPGPEGRDVILFVPSAGGVAVGELARDAMWQREMFPAATDFCVVDDETRDVLFCSTPMPESLLRIAPASQAQAVLRSTRWMREEEAQRAVAWPQFMRPGFGTHDWVVFASQAEGFQLARLLEHQRIYIPVVALAILLVTWLTIRQSRSIVEPVDRLARHARAIAHGDFAGRVAMDRADEFGELAGAFDQMSAKLGRQFAALTALSEIDQLILSTLDTAQVVRTVVERMGDVVPADFIGVTLFDSQSPGHAQACFRDKRAGAELIQLRVDITDADRELLASHAAGAWLAPDPSATGLLAQLRERGVTMAYVQPIVWRNQACGALALGYHEGGAVSDEERHQAREFADRVAVAVSSAWRDEQLYLQAHYDSLTGLPNRMLFKDRLGQEISRCHRESRRLAVLFIDIDRFKNVNDTLGHTAGDAVLEEAARRISGSVRESDTVSRLGGDEFTVLLTNLQHPQDAGRVADALVARLSEVFVVEGQRAFLSASVGIATFPEDGATADELLQNSDTAMYRAKAGGRALVLYFESRMNAEALARITLDRDLRQALDHGEISMHYQPMLDLRTGQLCAAEALMRWHHGERGPIAPGRFIPVAEETGFIEPLGRFALAAACAEVAAWRAAGLSAQRVSVNISPRQLRKAGLVEFIKRCAQDAGTTLEALEVEITEGLLIEHASVVEGLLRELHEAGARIALDDFGTGFSSMAYLNRFPIQTIKIDRTFTAGVEASRDSREIVGAIIAMSHALGKRVVAEGVETEEQLAFLRAHGCDEVQGFHVARPMPASAFREFVKARGALA